MLVLTRRLGEKLQIGDHISITVIAQSDSQIQLGITAPCDIVEEVYLRNTQSPGSAQAPVEESGESG